MLPNNFAAPTGPVVFFRRASGHLKTVNIHVGCCLFALDCFSSAEIAVCSLGNVSVPPR